MPKGSKKVSHANQNHDPEPNFTDPVCGMTTDSGDAFTRFEYKDRPYYFCSDHCL